MALPARTMLTVRPGRSLSVIHHVASREDAPKLFFVHGSCANLMQFEHQMLWCVERDVSFVAFDALGCGHSHKPDDWYAYAEDEMYADVAELIRSHSGPRNYVVGHSFGTCLASRFAGSDGLDLVHGLVLIGTQPHLPPGAAHWIFKMPLFVLEWIRPALGQAFVSKAFHEHTVTNKPDLIARSRQESASNPFYMIKAFYRQMKWDCARHYDAIRAPTVIVAGEADQLTPAAEGSKVAERIAGAVVEVIEQTSHQVMQEAPHRVNAILERFVLGGSEGAAASPLLPPKAPAEPAAASSTSQ